MPQDITERLITLESATRDDSGQLLVEFITPGWGSSGYYSPEVVEAAAPLFAVGTHLYLDHPTPTEDSERPVRSVKDLAAVIVEAGTWSDGGIRGKVKPFGPYRELLLDEDFAKNIGLSIRASASDIVIGEAEGRKGPIIESLVDLKSVDFVTRAGRGGRVLQVLESATGEEVTARAVAHGVAEATADERRQQLSDAVRTAYAGEDRYAWVADFDDDTVWFQASAENERTRMWQQSYDVAADDSSVTLTGDAIEVRQVIRYQPISPTPNVPATRSDSTTTTESLKEDAMPDNERQLEEALGRVQTLESERDTEREARIAAERERDQLRATEAARGHARTRVTTANATLPVATVDRIVAEATRTVPLTEAGQLDTAALDTAVDAARTAEETYLAGLAEAAGVGTVRGFGGSTATQDTGDEITESDIDNAVAGAFGRQVKEA